MTNFTGDQNFAMQQREAISAACYALALAEGFDAVTLEAVADRAGLPMEAVLDHFDDVDELVEYVIVDEIGQVMAEAAVLFSSGTSAPDVIVEVFAYTYRRLADTLTFRELLGPARDRLMAHLRGDRPETLILALNFASEELRTLGERTGMPLHDNDAGAEFYVRLLLSLLVSPQLGPDLSEDGVVEALVRRWLLPGMFDS
ncbi:TetR/AcrR family transcriptional regulator [Aeromicrobium sp. 9AM]|uniref:TetR/AcrR family transcriptional regulator n=1 Tax=Aeromicrobium sp. 9AM TaxID=2653126 RepID=UPI0012EFBEA8|nr:TetR/AcrR family transcriptional regulator [Aeromicrobium sp. 9AM]VXC22361.1 putative Transcriptional regulator TetR family [Aeromicrobium sp. 9AM]